LPGKKFWKIDQIRGNKNCSPSEKVYSEIVETLSARLKTVESIEVVR
jgi:hypothetical protein